MLDITRNVRYNGIKMKQDMGGRAASYTLYRDRRRRPHPHFNPIPNLKPTPQHKPPILKPPAVAFTSGYKAFLIWIPFFNNPYRDNPNRGLWVNGYKKAERETHMRDLWYMKGRERRYE